MESLALTSAELAFLLTFADETAQQRALSRLRLNHGDHGEAVVRDGLSSLAARGLAVGTGTDLTLAPPVVAVLNGLAEPLLWVEISAFTKDAADAAQAYVHDGGIFVLSPRAYGTFEVRGVRAGVSPAELLVSVAHRFLGRQQPAFVACRCETATVAVAGLADGTWAVSGDAAGSERLSATLDEALRDFASALASLSPEMTAA